MNKNYVFLEKRRVKDDSKHLKRFLSIRPSFEKLLNVHLDNYDLKQVDSQIIYTDSEMPVLEQIIYVSSDAYLSLKVYNNKFEGGLYSQGNVFDTLCFDKKHSSSKKDLLTILEINGDNTFCDVIDAKLNSYKGILRHVPDFEYVGLSEANKRLADNSLNPLPFTPKSL